MSSFNLGPNFVRQFKALRTKVDALASAVHRLGRQNPGGYVLSEIRTVSPTLGTGAVGVAIDTSGVGTPLGCVITYASPSASWAFRVFPRTTDIVVQNDAGTQSFTIQYRVIGTG